MKSILIIFFGLLLVLDIELLAQNPTYVCVLKNDTLYGNNFYEFDIYIQRTGTTPFELSGCQIGLTFNDNIRNNGTLTATYITGTCEFGNSAQVPANPNVATLQGTTRVWKLASKAPPGAGSGSIISSTAPGTRVGRFRLSNTVAFAAEQADFAWTFSISQYETKISAYVNSINTLITVPTSHLNQLTNAPLAGGPYINWCNLQWPASGIITQGSNFDVYAQIYVATITPGPGQGASIAGWIGYSTTNTNPNTWTNWVPATYNSSGPTGNNDEYMTNIGVLLPVGTYYYASRFQYSSGSYKYGGYSSDGGGFWDGTTYVSCTLTINPGTTAVSFSTSRLWNMVSVPGTATQMSKDSLFKGNTSAAFWFSGSSYVAENPLSIKKGYWLKFDSVRSHTVNVVTANSQTIDLNTGWNLIGTVHQNVAASSVTTNPPSILSSSFFGYNNGYFAATTLEKAKGYWIKSSATGTMTISTTLSKDEVNNVASIIDPAWRIINISDAAGNSQNLYLAEKLSENGFDLPPTPPAGIFDVRFSSQRFVEFDGAKSVINLNSVVYPVAITLSNSSKGFYRIKDAFGGTFLNVVPKDGQQVVVSNPAISAILIEGSSVPVSFDLMQNYPNPFNPSTVIRYAIPESGHVNLSVYNGLGEKILTLVDEVQTTGYYSLDFNAKKLSSGIYFINIRSNDFSKTIKAMLVK